MSGDLPEAVAAVTAEAGQLALARIGGDYRSWDKAPGQPVCDVDLAVDRFLRERLHALDPDPAWLSEETADDPARLAARRLWIVDPIDGTRDYLRRRTGWCVSVALVEDGAPTVGVLSAPARHEMWTAGAGRGARRNGVRIEVAPRDRLAGARMPADSLAKDERELVAVAKPNSIALRMAMVAAGEADLLLTAKWGNEWDIAASVLIAREAGALVANRHGAPIEFNTPGAKAYGLIVAAPGIHAAAVERFARPASEPRLG